PTRPESSSSALYASLIHLSNVELCSRQHFRVKKMRWYMNNLRGCRRWISGCSLSTRRKQLTTLRLVPVLLVL
ncbi:hypothetical protein M378DRAFT_1025701, partial [Amanita muscaria Koide BX008]